MRMHTDDNNSTAKEIRYSEKGIDCQSVIRNQQFHESQSEHILNSENKSDCFSNEHQH